MREVYTFVDSSKIVACVDNWKARDRAVADAKNRERDDNGGPTMNNRNLAQYSSDPDARFGVKGRDDIWLGYKRHVGPVAKCRPCGIFRPREPEASQQQGSNAVARTPQQCRTQAPLALLTGARFARRARKRHCVPFRNGPMWESMHVTGLSRRWRLLRVRSMTAKRFAMLPQGKELCLPIRSMATAPRRESLGGVVCTRWCSGRTTLKAKTSEKTRS